MNRGRANWRNPPGVVLEPEDIEVDLVALEQVVVSEAVEPLGLVAGVAILRVIAGDEIVQVGALESIGLEREVLVGAQIVNPELLVQGFSLAGLRSKKRTLALTPWA